ncbi:MAG TPA: hypothetical protein VGZ23_09310 [bacterium]|nr:hypothetical protein [bacterium]
MTRKAVRGRKSTARAKTRTAARTTTRTGRKTASARASKPATRLPRPPRVSRGDSRGTSAKPGTPVTPRNGQVLETEATHEPVQTAQHEDDEDLDWLGEDEDPRSQIVEDDDEWEPQGDDEW